MLTSAGSAALGAGRARAAAGWGAAAAALAAGRKPRARGGGARYAARVPSPAHGMLGLYRLVAGPSALLVALVATISRIRHAATSLPGRLLWGSDVFQSVAPMPCDDAQLVHLVTRCHMAMVQGGDASLRVAVCTCMRHVLRPLSLRRAATARLCAATDGCSRALLRTLGRRAGKGLHGK